MKKKNNQSKIFEFTPANTMTHAELLELVTHVRIGVGGHIIDNMSEELKKHFKELNK